MRVWLQGSTLAWVIIAAIGVGCDVEDDSPDMMPPPGSRKIEITVARHVDQLNQAATSADVDTALNTNTHNLCKDSGNDDAECAVQMSQRADSGSTWGQANDGKHVVNTNAQARALMDKNHAFMTFVSTLRRCGNVIEPAACTIATVPSTLVLQTSINSLPSGILHETVHQLGQLQHLGNCNHEVLMCNVRLPLNVAAEYRVRNGICDKLLNNNPPAGAKVTLSHGFNCP